MRSINWILSDIFHYLITASSPWQEGESNTADQFRETTTIHDDHQTQLETVLKSFGFYRAFELLFITIVCTLCRFHIMVWTVFAPKVLYEMMFSLMMSFLLSMIYVIRKLFITKENKNKNE